MRFLLLLLFPFVLSGQFDRKYESYKFIKVDDKLKPYFRQIRHFYRQNRVEFDYRKIKAIRYSKIYNPENTGTIAGYWDVSEKTVVIAPLNPVAYQYNVQDKVFIVTLAHEMWHSQGKEHDSTALMATHNGMLYNLLILEEARLTDILLEPFKE